MCREYTYHEECSETLDCCAYQDSRNFLSAREQFALLKEGEILLEVLMFRGYDSWDNDHMADFGVTFTRKGVSKSTALLDTHWLKEESIFEFISSFLREECV